MPAPLRLPRLKHQHEARHCHICGSTYNRRNIIETWTSQNQGHRDGWIKTTLKVCTRCGPEARSRRLVILATQRRG